MAYEGQLIRLGNGRWARFQHCAVEGPRSPSWDGAILVAVELDERYQGMLDQALGSMDEELYDRGVPMQMRLRPDERGEMTVQVEEPLLH